MKLPLPVIRILNPVVVWLLRSPLHGLLSKETLLITFTGRKTGRTYTTPVSYARAGDRIHVFTGFPWWRNLLERPEVTLLLQGEEHRGTAEVSVDDTERVRQAIKSFLHSVPRDKVYYNFSPAGEPDSTTEIDGKNVPVALVEIRLTA